MAIHLPTFSHPFSVQLKRRFFHEAFADFPAGSNRFASELQ